MSGLCRTGLLGSVCGAEGVGWRETICVAGFRIVLAGLLCLCLQ